MIYGENYPTVQMVSAVSKAPEEIISDQWDALKKYLKSDLNNTDNLYLDPATLPDNPFKAVFLCLEALIGKDWYMALYHLKNYYSQPTIRLSLLHRDPAVEHMLGLHFRLDNHIGVPLTFDCQDMKHTPEGQDEVFCEAYYFPTINATDLWKTPELVAEAFVSSIAGFMERYAVWTKSNDESVVEKISRIKSWESLCDAAEHPRTDSRVALTLGNYVKATVQRNSDYTTTTTLKGTTKNTIRLLTSLVQTVKSGKKLKALEAVVAE